MVLLLQSPETGTQELNRPWSVDSAGFAYVVDVWTFRPISALKMGETIYLANETTLHKPLGQMSGQEQFGRSQASVRLQRAAE